MNPFSQSINLLGLTEKNSGEESQTLYVVLSLGAAWYDAQQSPGAATQANCFSESAARLHSVVGDNAFARYITTLLMSASRKVR